MEPDQLLSSRYQLRERLGSGGMSVVYRAHDEVLDRDVAVKVLADSVPTDLRTRLRAEARAAASLNHPSIAAVHDYGEFNGQPYLVMELVNGESMAEWLRRDTRIPWPDATAMCGDLADALAAVHAAGLVHRDVKPANVIISGRGAKLVDFGICAPAGADDGSASEVLGTAAFVAPERIAGAPVGPAADVYALGLLFYWLVSGALPWSAATTEDLLNAHLFAPPTPLSVDGLPVDLAAIVMDALAKDPAGRPAAGELATAMRAARVDATAPLITAIPPILGRAAAVHPTAMLPVIRPSGRRRALAIGAAALAGVALLAVVWSSQGGTPRSSSAGIAEPPAAVCTASFQIDRDWGDGFDATVTVTEGAKALPDWTVGFTFPGSQTAVMRGDASVAGPSSTARTIHTTVRQSGSRVEAAGTALPAGSTVTIPIRGSYHETNPLPTAISLADHECATSVGGATVTPAPVTNSNDDSGKGKGDDNGNGHGKGHGNGDGDD